jgi:hypothetical protein
MEMKTKRSKSFIENRLPLTIRSDIKSLTLLPCSRIEMRRYGMKLNASANNTVPTTFVAYALPFYGDLIEKFPDIFEPCNWDLGVEYNLVRNE